MIKSRFKRLGGRKLAADTMGNLSLRTYYMAQGSFARVRDVYAERYLVYRHFLELSPLPLPH
ncbi:hypothetical protein PMI31_02245 [Pseudomonas sp. GM55]|nr:hypothetical protein PMI31_02245 [Pseudomonas sp. GM55]